MTNPNSAAQAANDNPLSDEYVNAIIQRHGYDSPESVIAQLHQWIGLHGGEDTVTLLMYEAHKALSKLRAPVADERAAFEKLVSQWNQPMDRAGWGYEDPKIQDAWWIWNMSRGTHPSDTRAALASARVADERASEQTAPGRQYHILKTDPEVFQAVMSGAKTFEIRLNDRGYAVGDVLGLRETKHTGAEMRAGAPLVYTGRECQRFVSHVLTGYGLADGWCCLSFRLPHAGGASAPVAGEAPRPWGEIREDANGDLAIFTPSHNAKLGTFTPGAAGEFVKGDLLYAAPQASEARCSCPSGDGSLRHPCAVHPAGEGVPVAWAIFSPSGNIRYWHHDKANVEEFAAKHGLTVCGVANAGPQSRDAEQIADLVLGHAEGLRVSSLLESGTGFGKDVEHRFQVSNGQDRYGVVIILTALSAQPGAQKEQSDA